jgi:hypothetical protein
MIRLFAEDLGHYPGPVTLRCGKLSFAGAKSFA